jgi:hypothetical protein
MRNRLQILKSRLEELEDKANDSGEVAAGHEIASYRNADTFEEIEQKIDLWEKGDHVAAGQARNLLVDAAKRVQELASKVEWPARVAQYEERKVDVRRAVHENGEASDQETLATLIVEGDQAVQAKHLRLLEQVDRRLAALGYAMHRMDPAYLAGWLAYLAEQEESFLDRRKAQNLLQEGAMAMRRKDTEAVESIISELVSLLPPDKKAEADTAIKSSII